MQNLHVFTEIEKQQLINTRTGETKFGEAIQLLPKHTNLYEAIKDLDVDYVIFGISEAIGVYANHGKTGTQNACKSAIKALLNTQNNSFTKSEKVLLLGELSYENHDDIINKKPSKSNIKNARTFVNTIDADVSYLVAMLIKAGKIPIIIGGGHNNAYGAIKGSALANNTKLNVVNLDAHTDLRPLEGRHSGNGFSYAIEEGFLDTYFMFGIHENYTSSELFETLNATKKLKFNTYEALEVRQTLNFNTELKKALKCISKQKFGIEIDCDAIKNIPSSAMSSSGFSVKQARQFVHHFGNHKNATYLHICEAAPKPKTEALVGKLISYLVTDFIRSNAH